MVVRGSHCSLLSVVEPETIRTKVVSDNAFRGQAKARAQRPPVSSAAMRESSRGAVERRQDVVALTLNTQQEAKQSIRAFPHA